MCLNEIYNKVRIGKNLSGALPIQNGLKQGDVLSSLLFSSTRRHGVVLNLKKHRDIFTFTLEYVIRKVQENRE
jgi:hypothetical protein